MDKIVWENNRIYPDVLTPWSWGLRSWENSETWGVLRQGSKQESIFFVLTLDNTLWEQKDWAEFTTLFWEQEFWVLYCICNWWLLVRDQFWPLVQMILTILNRINLWLVNSFSCKRFLILSEKYLKYYHVWEFYW